MDSIEFLPSPRALERLRQDLKAYESKRSALAARTRWRLIAMMGAWALPSFLVLGVAWDIWLKPDNISATFLVLAGVVFGGIFAYSRARKPAREMQEAFREHLFPMIFGFIDDMRHTRGVEPDSFAAIPDYLKGTFNRKSFDDCVPGVSVTLRSNCAKRV